MYTFIKKIAFKTYIFKNNIDNNYYIFENNELYKIDNLYLNI